MAMGIREIPKDEYAELYKASEFSFLQSPEWAELKKDDGYSPRFFAYEGGAILALSKSYPVLGTQAYIPRPLFVSASGGDKPGDKIDEQLKAAIPAFATEMKKLFGVVLVDMDLPPALLANEEAARNWASRTEAAFSSAGFKAGKTIQPVKTAIVDLTCSEEEWLSLVRKSARERIKAGVNAGASGKISIKRIDPKEEPDELNTIIEKIVMLSEEKFNSRKTGYLNRMVELFGEKAVIWSVRAGDRCEGGSIGILDENQKIYHTIYSAIAREVLREHNAGYLLKLYQWRLGHELGYKWMDMWGVETDPNHPWYGFSQFKLGFGAKIVEYPKQFRLFRSPLFKVAFSLSHSA